MYFCGGWRCLRKITAIELASGKNHPVQLDGYSGYGTQDILEPDGPTGNGLHVQLDQLADSRERANGAAWAHKIGGAGESSMNLPDLDE